MNTALLSIKNQILLIITLRYQKNIFRRHTLTAQQTAFQPHNMPTFNMPFLKHKQNLKADIFSALGGLRAVRL
jgi:hypothetical protein